MLSFAEISEFFWNNFWICLGVGVLIVVVGDEVLGVSRNLLSDGTEDMKFTADQRRKQREDAAPPDPLDDLEAEEGETSIDDFLGGDDRRR